MKRILAIDPGMSGGLAYLGPSGVILNSMPTTDQDISILVTDRLAVERVGDHGSQPLQRVMD